MAGVFE